MFWVMYNLYVLAAGHDQLVVGKVVSVTSLASALSLIPAGILSDRFDRKRVILIGGILTTTTLALRSILEVESALLTTAFIEGLFASLMNVSFLPLISENSEASQRVHLFSFLSALGMIAGVVGNVGGGILADFFQHMMGYSELISLRITLLIGTGIICVALFPLLRIQTKNKASMQKPEREKRRRFDLKSFIQKNKPSLKIILLFTVAELLIGFGAGLVIPYLNIYFSDRFDASKTAIGVIVSLGQAATAIAMLLGPMVVKKIGDVKAIVSFQLGSIPFLLLTGFTTNFYLASTGYLFRQALMNAAGPIQMSVMMEKVDDSMKGLANSVGSMNFTMGWALMGPVSTSIVSAYGPYWGYATVFSITAFLYVLGAVYFYLVFAPKGKAKESGLAAKS